MPKVSVIVPIYGVEKYLKECVDSILSQTFEDMEILLIDDGGKDNCPQIIDEYARKDTRIIPIHKKNGGYGNSCNVGLDKAAGEYIAIIEPDDYIDKDMFRDLYDSAKKYESDVVKSDFYVNYQNGSESEVYLHAKTGFGEVNKNPFRLEDEPKFFQYHPSIWSCIYKREFLNRNNIRFEEAPGAGWTDNPFAVKTMCLADRISYVNKAYYYWRVLNYDDLKDITIPFKRTKEIHEWLDAQNITDENILANLYLREIKYLQIINRVIKFGEIPLYKELLDYYFKTVHWEVVENSNVFKKKKAKYLKNIQNNPAKVILTEKLKKIKKDILSIRFTKKEKYIKLFGKYVWKRIAVERI